MSLSWLSLLYVILALAVLSLDDDDSLINEVNLDFAGDPHGLSKHYRSLAMRCLAADGVMWRHNLRTLQSLVLLIYAMSHSQAGSSTWTLLGTTYQIALAIGCHVDPSQLGLGLVESEERRRCWAGLVMLYTIQNSALQNLDTRCLSQDVDLPADLNDTDLLYGQPTSSSQRPTQMSYLLYKFQLYQISTKINSLLLGQSRPPLCEISRLETEIFVEKEKWDLRYHMDNAQQQLPLHHQVQLYILHGYSHHMVLLLLRSQILGTSSHADSSDRCIKSAVELLRIHGILFEAYEYRPYRWYTLGLGSFYAFHACTLLVTVLLDQGHAELHDRLRDQLEQTIRRLESAQWRSSICKHATRTLHKLLTTLPTNNMQHAEPVVGTLEYPMFDLQGYLGDSGQAYPFDVGQFAFDLLDPLDWMAPPILAA